MEYVKLQLQQSGLYLVNDYNDEDLCQLGDFLSDAITNDFSYEFYTGFLKGKYNQNSAAGNAYQLTKYNGIILVHAQYYLAEKEPIGDDPCPSFKTTQQELLEIIDDWVRASAFEPEPKEILIIQDSGKITIKPAD